MRNTTEVGYVIVLDLVLELNDNALHVLTLWLLRVNTFSTYIVSKQVSCSSIGEASHRGLQQLSAYHF